VKDSGFARIQLEQIDIAKRAIAKYPDVLVAASTAADVRAAFKAGKVGSLLGMEGGHAIENSLGALRAYYSMGVRYMTLTHNVTLDWADAALDSAKHGGLTNFGREVVREMNRLGMLVDISHVSPGVMSNALDVTESPVIFSHSGARALVDHARNVPDSILKRMPKNGGVVMVNFYPVFLSDEVSKASKARDEKLKPEIAALKAKYPSEGPEYQEGVRKLMAANPLPKVSWTVIVDHIDHMVKVAGIDHVGIGSDFDGIGEVPEGMEDISKLPKIPEELKRRGYSDGDIRKIMGDNFLRVFAEAERVAKEMQAAK